MEWKYSDYFATFEVVPLEHPYIDIQLPALTCLWKSMKIGLSTDFSDIDYPNISLSISFSGDAIKIPSQKGKATVDNDTTCTYVLDDKGQLQFFLSEEDIEEEKNKIYLSQHKITMQLDFMMEKQTDASDIIVKTDVGGILFEETNKVSFKFPIECNIRLQTQDFTHICLHNTSEIDLVIESAEIMPDTWGKMIGRVNGINFSAIYGATRATARKKITLPEGYTWKKFMYFLLSTLPEPARDNYLRHLSVSQKFWKTKGGCVSDKVIQKLIDLGIPIEIAQKSNYKTTKHPVKMDYQDDIDIPEFKELPTYKRMCICILRNDHACKYMGFSPTKEQISQKSRIIKEYKNIWKQ